MSIFRNHDVGRLVCTLCGEQWGPELVTHVLVQELRSHALMHHAAGELPPRMRPEDMA